MQGLKSQIELEILMYLTGVVNVSENYDYSQPILVRRIALFANHIYPTGKFDSTGNYKFWFDIVTPRIYAEVKNIDFDTKDIQVFSDRKIDDVPILILNLALKDWLRENHQAEEFEAAIEEGTGWGNCLWKKIRKNGRMIYERQNLLTTYIINQTAENVDETPIIERHQMSYSELQAMSGIWYPEAVKIALKDCGQNIYSATQETVPRKTSVPYYDVYERNGEVKVADYKREKGEPVEEGDEDKYMLAKVVVVATKSVGTIAVTIEHVLYCEELPGKMSDWYKEYHRLAYKGRWFREGIIELLFDLQVRANQIGNQLAQGLEFASKILFTTDEKMLIQNAMTDLTNGDIVRAKNLQHLSVKMEGFSELANEWNRVLQLADNVSNAGTIVMGDAPASRISTRVFQLLNQNADKLFDFIRKKLANPIGEIFDEWIIPAVVRDLKAKDVLRITGDSDMMDRLYGFIADSWYLENMLAIGPHTQEVAQALKLKQIEELKARPALLIEGLKKAFEDFKPYTSVVITGENSRLPEELKSINALIALEQDPVRRSALIELSAKKQQIDIASLPKSPPQALMPGGGRGMAGAGAQPQGGGTQEYVGSQVGTE